jgi:hypothetical protein
MGKNGIYMKNILTRENIFQAIKELLWLGITGMVIYAILYPITQKIDFIYWRVNSLFIFITITYFRYSVTFRSLPFLRPAWLRFILFTANLSLFIYIWHNELKFIQLADNFYTEDFGFPKVILYDNLKEDLFKYLYQELVAFGTASLIMISAFQMRLIISYWQYYKHQADTLLEG